jgi:hypothetical protein
MLARDAGVPAIVICTGHGPLFAPADDHGAPAKAPKGKGGSVCAFAGHGGTPTATPLLALTPVRFDQAARVASGRPPTTPGQGLAAPPPPSQAPPRIL